MRKAASQRYSYISFVLIALIAFALTVSVPVVFSAASNVVSAKALTSHDCDTSEWHFVITQVDSQANAPAQINVAWADGGTASVPMDKYTGKTAHYTTTAHLNSTVTSATASIYAGWSGEFNLSHGPCGAVSTPVPTASPTASPTVVPTSTPVATPVVTPTATPVPTVTPTVAPTATPGVTVTPTNTPGPVSNGLSDNLGCSVHDCSGNVIPQGGVVLGAATELPSTGGFNVMPLVYALMSLITGVALVRVARVIETK